MSSCPARGAATRRRRARRGRRRSGVGVVELVGGVERAPVRVDRDVGSAGSTSAPAASDALGVAGGERAAEEDRSARAGAPAARPRARSGRGPSTRQPASGRAPRPGAVEVVERLDVDDAAAAVCRDQGSERVRHQVAEQLLLVDVEPARAEPARTRWRSRAAGSPCRSGCRPGRRSAGRSMITSRSPAARMLYGDRSPCTIPPGRAWPARRAAGRSTTPAASRSGRVCASRGRASRPS